MATREEYLARAELAELQGRQARSPREREAFREIARLWRGLADQLTRRAEAGER